MNDDDFKDDSDYLDVVKENKKEYRNEIISTVIKSVLSLVAIVVICFLGYKATMFGINKLKNSGMLVEDDPVEQNVVNDDSNNTSDTSTTKKTNGKICEGVYSATIKGVVYDWVLYDDNTYTIVIGDDVTTGEYKIEGTTLILNPHSNKKTYTIDSSCNYIMMGNSKLNKK
jgi:hypothetical protein